MRKKNCKITIEHINDSKVFKGNKVKRIYTFDDYRICYAVANLLDCINSKWINRKTEYID